MNRRIRLVVFLLLTAALVLAAATAMASGVCAHGKWHFEHDAERHYAICDACDEWLWSDYHAASCSRPGVCDDCGVAYTGKYVVHGNSHYEYDPDKHWEICDTCGKVLWTWEHEAACRQPNVCGECGAPYAGSVIYHEHSTTRSDENNHWDVCDDCGEISWGPYEHRMFCRYPGVCAYCGAACTGSRVIHGYTTVAHDETNHWGVCYECHEIVGTPQAHYTEAGDPRGVCSECGATYGSVAAVALTPSAATAKVGDILTFTTQMEGAGGIAWIEYHIYDAFGNHLSGYRGEGSGVSGVYHFPTASTGAGRYTARVYLMAKDGTFTQVDSAPVTVTAGTRKAVALNANTTSAKVGDTLTFTTQFEGDGPIAWIEYHVYDMSGNHLTGYRGEGANISGVYRFPTASIGAGRYTARVYLMAKDGTFTQVDSAPVTVAADTRRAVGLSASAATARVGDTLTFTTQFEGSGEIAWIEYHIYDSNGNHVTGYRGEGSGVSGVYHYTIASVGSYTARVCLMAADGTYSQVDSARVTVAE